MAGPRGPYRRDAGAVRAGIQAGVRIALDRRDIRFRDDDAFAIDAFYFSTFFGGSDATWAPSKDEHASFDGFAVGTGRL